MGDAAQRRGRRGDRGPQPETRLRGAAVRADRVRAVGLGRPVAGNPGGVGGHRGRPGHRGGLAPGARDRGQPGLALLPQPGRLPGRVPLRPGGAGGGRRLGVAGGAGRRRVDRPRPPRAPRAAAPGGGRRPERPWDDPPPRGDDVTHTTGSADRILDALQERAKELHCLYRVHELANHQSASLDEIFRELVEVIPRGWQYPADCFARIEVDGTVWEPPDTTRTPWSQSASIRAMGEVVGSLEVFYDREYPESDEGPFLKEERKLLDTIAERLGQLLLQRRLLDRLQATEGAAGGGAAPLGLEWRAVVDFLRSTDRHLFVRVSRRMINYLCWEGIPEALALLPRIADGLPGGDESLGSDNRPLARRNLDSLLEVAEEAFLVAARHLSGDEILSCVQTWIRDDRSGFLVEIVENQRSSLADIAQALDRYHHEALDDRQLSHPIQTELRVALARRYLTDQLDFVAAAKENVDVADYWELSRRVISPPRSHGKIGGKGAGLILAAQIVRRSAEYSDALRDIRIPKTWYVTSDGVLDFIEYNHLEDLYNRKYLEIDQVRREFPHIIQVFKNSRFSPEIVKGLSVALDDFDDRPLIVRSSSLLEDRVGSAFSGKYRSLFLANQGTKAERLAALMDAIAEVYASIFGPDPIEYRAERGLLDVHEEMGILIQDVVGTRVGRWHLPTFAGVAFSNNEFRWSPRIRREDGLLRLVPGLGTRAVDRIGDDYPVLIAPGQPGLRVSVTADEIARYSPRRVDVIDLEARRFDTIELSRLLEEAGTDLPGIGNVVSICDEGGRLHRPSVVDWDLQKDRLVATFDGLASATPFVTQMRSLLRVLEERTGGAVDIEFASDGRDLYLLQCRPQSFSDDSSAAPIPRDLPADSVVFTANRFVSNGRLPEVTHVVYVDPDAYARVPDLATLRRVGRAVGRLNKVLPKRRFILMGPGRWGSRGDIKLGVAVTYSDINNTSLLVEIARRRGNYVPDLSFGTHFFQDLVEASIRYVPLFPDDGNVAFNEGFLLGAPNVLPEVLPEFGDLAGVVRLIDVPGATGGLVLRVLMNAEEDRAVAYLTSPGASAPEAPHDRRRAAPEPPAEDHWRWRLKMAERIAASVDAARFGVKAMYVVGSTKNASAGPGSDIDLLVHVDGDEARGRDLAAWLEGWSLCLAELN
ncbi:hypothetical protein FBQ97_09120, partial [Acidobacteria bacterium ACD]|nr:hypothetical protein [Acidobacteria bacterium ACD]